MEWVECTTQAEVDAAVKAGNAVIVRAGYFEASGSASVTAYDSASVTAYGSASVTAYDSASVTAYDSASVRAYDSASVRAYGSASVTAYDSASVRAYDSASVRAYGSASVTASGSASVRAYDSASVRAYGSASVTASGSASVRASGSASVRATPCVPVQDHGPDVTVNGGVHIPIPTPDTIDTWATFYGTKTSRGWVTVYKAVNDDLASNHGFAYPIGTEVACTDWNDREACGNGLHFSPHPHMAAGYASAATRFLECRVKATEVVVLGDKLKAPRCKVIREVTIHGEAVA